MFRSSIFTEANIMNHARMSQSFQDRIKNEWENQKKIQAQMENSPENQTNDSKKYYRKIGVFLVILGCAAFAALAIYFFVADRISILLLATTLGLLGIGLKMIVTGKSIV
jgi:hypothetical protein